ncbi:hypothetical protein LCGC14_0801110 [marine sediment metagenome]|uniref:7-cyano-7-deazaguanine synthase n=1 Tax=marine sediment metagenome TaxID=412755 RepID=A0A0F9PPJ1_9ZZZZ
MPLGVLLLSGGIDSTTLAYHYSARGYTLHCLSFDYGQKHRKELLASTEIARCLGARHDILDISAVGALLSSSGSVLVGDGDVPEGHYSAESMKSTIVPNRNAIMLSIAFGVAVAEGAEFVGYAAHSGDHFIYPDCRPAFVDAFRAMEVFSLGCELPNIRSPFIHMTKAEVVSLGHNLHVPFTSTWSCYVGEDRHCGRCGTCVERAEAFSLAGVVDPTLYGDPEYWRIAVAHA